MKPLILFHADCADGAGAAFAAWCKFGDEATYRSIQYDNPPPEDAAGRDVFLVDFCYKKANLALLSSIALSVTVFDHHKTAAEEYIGMLLDGHELAAHRDDMSRKFRWEGKFQESWCPVLLHFDQEHSGAMVAWGCLHESAAPEILRYIEDRDLWKWKMPKSKEVSAALEARGVREDWRVLTSREFGCLHPNPNKWDCGGWDKTFATLVAEGSAVLRAHDQQIRFIASTAEVVMLDSDDGECFLAACSPVLQSEVGAVLAIESDKQARFPMSAIWYRDGRANKFRVSLRSIGDFDVAVIAKRYGGGGHRNAAGFTCETLPW